MEEILASIRQIISEDGEGLAASKAPTPADVPSGEPARAPTAYEPPAYESAVSRFDSVPAPSSESSGHPEFGREAAPRWKPDDHSDDLEPTIRPHFPAARSEEDPDRLLSPEKGAAVAGSFGALAETMLAHQTRTLEDVVAEMLQPMLKSWLDNNLPSLVERMVREEIERVSRGRR
jgi:cell pole-organizing protein PopZ